jgi:hypothetical protein
LSLRRSEARSGSRTFSRQPTGCFGLAWFALINQSLETSVVLNDLGAFCLIAFSIAFSEGAAAVKKYVVPLCAFFTLDVIYMLSVNVLVHSHTPGETASSYLKAFRPTNGFINGFPM